MCDFTAKAELPLPQNKEDSHLSMLKSLEIFIIDVLLLKDSANNIFFSKYEITLLSI